MLLAHLMSLLKQKCLLEVALLPCSYQETKTVKITKVQARSASIVEGLRRVGQPVFLATLVLVVRLLE